MPYLRPQERSEVGPVTGESSPPLVPPASPVSAPGAAAATAPPPKAAPAPPSEGQASPAPDAHAANVGGWKTFLHGVFQDPQTLGMMFAMGQSLTHPQQGESPIGSITSSLGNGFAMMGYMKAAQVQREQLAFDQQAKQQQLDMAQQGVDIAAAGQQETAKYHAGQLDLSGKQLTEQTRHATAMEDIGKAEARTAAGHLGVALQTLRGNLAHLKAVEQSDEMKTRIDAASKVLETAQRTAAALGTAQGSTVTDQQWQSILGSTMQTMKALVPNLPFDIRIAPPPLPTAVPPQTPPPMAVPPPPPAAVAPPVTTQPAPAVAPPQVPSGLPTDTEGVIPPPLVSSIPSPIGRQAAAATPTPEQLIVPYAPPPVARRPDTAASAPSIAGGTGVAEAVPPGIQAIVPVSDQGAGLQRAAQQLGAAIQPPSGVVLPGPASISPETLQQGVGGVMDYVRSVISDPSISSMDIMALVDQLRQLEPSPEYDSLITALESEAQVRGGGGARR